MICGNRVEDKKSAGAHGSGRIARITAGAVLPAVMMLLSSCIDVDSVLVFPGTRHALDRYDFSGTELGSIPEDRWEQFVFEKDSVELAALYVAGSDAPEPEFSRGTVLFFGGNASTLYTCVGPAMLARNLGLDFFAVEYRGYGLTAGLFETTERSIYEDGLTAYRYLTQDLGVPPDEIVIGGMSLGTSVAVRTAAESREAGVMLFAPMYNADFAGETISGGYSIDAGWFTGARLDNASRIGSIGSPLVIFHGANDELFPPSHARGLFERAQEPKFLYIHPSAGHADLFYERSWFRPRLIDFLRLTLE